MAAATAVALSSARQVSRSASTIFTREVSGSHKLTIDGYLASRKIPQAWSAPSQPFEAAGYSWRIRYFPNGRRKEGDYDCISLYLELVHGSRPHTDPVQFKFSLLDQAGNAVLDQAESGALKDDRFTIRCDITAIRDWHEPDSDDDGGGAPPVSTVAVPPSDDLHQQLSDLLWKQKHGADVSIDVAGETFDAHGWLLAARSPVLEAELQALMTSNKKEKEKEGAAARRVMS